MIKEYFRLYTKITLTNKVGFLWYLVFPLVAFVVYHYDWINSKPDIQSFYVQTSMFIAYIIFVMSIDVTTSLIAMRETGFLKMFKFVSGSKSAMIMGKILNQLAFLLLATLIFSVITGLMMLDDLKDAGIFVICSLFSSLFASIPVTFFLLILLLIPIKQESLVTILNILLFALFFITAKSLSHSASWGILLLYLNPLELIRSLTFLVTEIITGNSFHNFGLLSIGTAGSAYFILGLFSLKWMKITSPTQRT
ncbi:hypothetical protein P7H15_06010 [Paenibacillus larvae]|nr:hypothetical protein [Paenibacillus larvae]MDT2292554.1 hypothetical protein [Paenibacillus larvae]